jgi:hypothetical protein
MQLKKALAFAVVFIGFTATAFADVTLSMQDGRVTLVAKDATLRQILAEWARVGQTKIVNGDRVPGGPVTLQLTNVPEEQALDTLLRTLTGYVAAPRPTLARNLSQFDRIVIVPQIAQPVAPAGAAAGPAPATYPQPAMPTPFAQPGQVQPIPGVADDQDDDRPTVPRGPVFNTFPAPQVVAPQPQGYPTTTPGMVPPAQGPMVVPQPNPYGPQTSPYPGAPTTPAAVPTPGMIPQPPQQPGQPKRPGQGQ